MKFYPQNFHLQKNIYQFIKALQSVNCKSFISLSEEEVLLI